MSTKSPLRPTEGPETVYVGASTAAPFPAAVSAPAPYPEALETVSQAAYPVTPMPVSDAPLPVGTRLQLKYRIETVMGQGGFGITYKVRHEDLQGEYIIKESFPKGFVGRSADGCTVLLKDPAYYDCVKAINDGFIEEARNIARLSNGTRNANIIHVADYFVENGTAYYVMDYVYGKPLSQVMEEKTFSEAELTSILKQLLEGLGIVHRHGITHLDIKPDNILIDHQHGTPVLIDFGASRNTVADSADNLVFVTPDYAPPEQMSRDGVGKMGPYSDIYALGSCVYRLLTGDIYNADAKEKATTYIRETTGQNDAPFNSLTYDCLLGVVAPVLKNNMHRIMGLKEYSEDFRKALCKALQPEISQRFQRVEEWLDCLDAAKQKQVRDMASLAQLDALVSTKPAQISEKQLKELAALAAQYPAAYVTLARYHKYKANAGDTKAPESHLKKFEDYLKKALHYRIPDAARELAQYRLNTHLGNMSPMVLAEAADLYRQAGREKEANYCETAARIAKEYKKRALHGGMWGSHNMYLNAARRNGDCCFTAQQGDISPLVCPKLRGSMQLLCTLCSAFLAAPLVWLMAQREADAIAKVIVPVHLNK